MNIIAIIVVFSAGYIAAYLLHYKQKNEMIEAQEAETKETFSYAFNSGWESASQSPTHVKARYEEIFNSQK